MSTPNWCHAPRKWKIWSLNLKVLIKYPLIFFTSDSGSIFDGCDNTIYQNHSWTTKTRQAWVCCDGNSGELSNIRGERQCVLLNWHWCQFCREGNPTRIASYDIWVRTNLNWKGLISLIFYKCAFKRRGHTFGTIHVLAKYEDFQYCGE